MWLPPAEWRETFASAKRKQPAAKSSAPTQPNETSKTTER
jgi:hypothetical protein